VKSLQKLKKQKMTTKLTRNKVVKLLSQHETKQLGDSTVTYSDADTNPMIWQNEFSATGSLRLNKSGLNELKNCFKLWPIPLKAGFQVKNLHVKYLERDLIYPWYLDNKKLILFSQYDAMEIKLQAGDLDAWARARWVNDRYNEPPALPEENQ